MRKDCLMEGVTCMKGRRWHQEEDQLLKDTVLQSIQNGGTQLEAFAEVGKKLDRTPGACGFRWNAVLRQNDPAAYREAKRKRVYAHLEKRKELQIDSFQQMIQMLEKVDQERRRLQREVRQLSQSVMQKRDAYQERKQENQALQAQQLTLHSYEKEVKERYHDLLKLFTRLKQQLKKAEEHNPSQAIADTKLDSTT